MPVVPYIIINFIRIVITCRFGTLFLEGPRVGLPVRVLAAVFYTAVNSIAYYAVDSPVVNISVNFVMYMLFTFTYEGTPVMRLFSFAAGYILGMAVEGGTYLFMLGTDMSGQDAIMYTFVVSVVLMFVMTEMLRGLIRRGEYSEIGLRYKLLLLLIPLGSLYLCNLFVRDYDTSPENIAAVIVLLFINIAVFFIMELVVRSYRRIHRQDIMRMESEYYKNQLDIMRESNTRAAKIRHDFKNHLIALSMLTAENDGRAAEYIAGLLEVSETPGRIVSSGNIVVDSLLNYKLSHLLNADISLDIGIPGVLFVSDTDMCIILGNLLDNAAEALDGAEEKRLSIKMEYDRGMLFIGISNTFSGELRKGNGGFESTKRDGTAHGLGLVNVGETVRKYGGSVEYGVENGVFEVRAILFENA